MVMRILLSMVVAFAFAVSAGAASAKDRWVELGTHSLDPKTKRKLIDTRDIAGKYKALRLKAVRGDVVLNLVKVTYANGKVHNERRRINLLQGERTRPVDMRTSGRFIDAIDLRYRIFDPAAARVDLAIWGLRSDKDAGALRGGGRTVSVSPPGATDDVEVMFGSQLVGLALDRDSMAIGNQLGKFKQIRFRALEADLHVRKFTIAYTNGQSQAVTFNETIVKDRSTRWFTVRSSRFIDRISFEYRPQAGSGNNAVLQVIGRYADGWIGPNGGGRRNNNGWILLGAGEAGFVGFDQQKIAVGIAQGVLRRIRFVVRDRGITLRGLRIIYGNGAKIEVPLTKTKIDADSAYGPVDLSGTSWIREIQTYYRSRALSKGSGRATVEIWGQH